MNCPPSMSISPSRDPNAHSDNSRSSSEDIRVRSQSRLGFNSAPELSSREQRLTGTLKWTRSLFQRIGLDGNDENEMETPMTEGDASEILKEPLSTPLDLADECHSDDLDSSDVQLGTNVHLFPPPPAIRSSTPESGKTFVVHESIEATESDLPSLQPPSPNQPALPAKTTLLRHAYPHRGHSRSALMHQKWFWHARHEEWTEWTSHKQASANAYGGITILPDVAPRRYISSNNSSIASVQSPYIPPNMNAPIFPRTGDISALRDPYCAIIDRCFCQFPLWTIHKSLFMFDLHHRSTSFSHNLESDAQIDAVENHVSAGPSAMKMAADDTPAGSSPTTLNFAVLASRDDDSVSIGFSEDDITLVEDDSLVEEKCSDGEDDLNSESDNAYLWEGVRAWELTWYARWQLLTELAKRDTMFIRPATGSVNAIPDAGSDGDARQHSEEAQCSQILYLTGENVESDNDDDIYGTFLEQSLCIRLGGC